MTVKRLRADRADANAHLVAVRFKPALVALDRIIPLHSLD
jgi:hypothetical protein